MVFETALKILRLSETNNLGRPLRAENRFKLCRNAAVVESQTTSRCSTLVTQHIIIQQNSYLVVSGSIPNLDKEGAGKFTPANVKSGSSLTLKSGKGDAEGPIQGLPSNLLHMMHQRMTLTKAQPLTIQTLDLTSGYSVFLTPLCKTHCSVLTSQSRQQDSIAWAIKLGVQLFWVIRLEGDAHRISKLFVCEKAKLPLQLLKALVLHQLVLGQFESRELHSGRVRTSYASFSSSHGKQYQDTEV